MKKQSRMWVASALMLALAATATSCVHDLKSLANNDDADAVTERRQLSGFEQIEINGSPTVYYTQADSFSVVVKGKPSYLDNIITETDGRTLTVKNRGKIGVMNISFNNDSRMAVYVSSPDLTSIRLSGSGDFISQKRIDSDNMKITLRGSGDITVKDLICDRCTVDLTGSGNIDLDRLEAESVSATLVGSGDIDLNLHNVADTQLKLTGSGDIDARFDDGCRTADCQLRGSGDISLSGNLEHLKQQKGGSGDINTHKLTVEKTK